MFFIAGPFSAGQVRQVPQTAGVALVKANEKSPQQFDSFGMITAGRRYFIKGCCFAAHAEAGQQSASAGGVETAQRNQARVTAACQRWQWKARRQDYDAGQRSRCEFLQQSA